LEQQVFHSQDSAVRSLLQEESGVIRSAHFSGAGGSEVVQRRTALIDSVLRDVHGRLASYGPLPTIVAIGGYGRGELNPHSDIDIMLLCRNETERERSPEILYRLWDAGLDVGYSVRTAPECVDLGRSDVRIRTSLMESRFIGGSPDLYESFLAAMRSEVFYWKSGAFIQNKIAERTAGRQRYGSSIYLRQPNIKDGVGGLRDVHTAFWVSAVRYRVVSLADLVTNGVLTRDQHALFLRSRNFLWRLRNELHYLSARKNDHLTYDLQERAAADFGYRDSGHLLGVERFMKVYFLHARNIREFSNVVMDASLGRKPGLAFFSRTKSLGPFSLAGKTLIPSSEAEIVRNPASILSAFAAMQTRRARFSDRLKQIVGAARVDESVRKSPDAAAAFLAILDRPEHLFETLTEMKNLRFLGRYLPEFRAIQALAKHDYFHTYTVDEHTLIAIRNLQDLWTGVQPVHDSLVAAFRRIGKRWVLMLAVLLHDLGKAYRTGHEHRGVDLAAAVMGRLGIAEGDRERILFLVRNHLLMNRLSQSRELTDKKVIADFSRRVKDRENLDMLALLTYADVAAVSPGAWTPWRASLLLELYFATLSFLDTSKGADVEERSRIAAAIEKIRNVAPRSLSAVEIDRFVRIMPEKYLLYTPAQKAVDHLAMAGRLAREQLVIGHRHYPERGYTDLTVCAYDAYGMLSLIAGTLAAKNLSVLRAQVFTTRTGVMIDSLQVTDAEGRLYDYEEAWADVEADLRNVLTGKRRPPDPDALPFRGRAGSGMATSIDFDNDSSDAFTIIDVTGPDRVGLLYRITRALFDLNLDIGSAKIVTEGARVMDSFYVTDLFRRKIVDGERLEKIKEALLAVLS
jgi:[protein-PII] uridylyltransferase